MTTSTFRPRVIRSRISLVWLILVGATILSWIVGHGVVDDRSLAAAVIIAVAFLKVRFVILDFMEIRGAPLAMRLVGEAWVFLVCAVLIGLYLLPH